MAFTAQQLADFCVMVYNRGTPYWYGTCWYPCTYNLLDRKKTQYPNHYTESRMPKYEEAIAQGKYCCDCVGMIKGFFWSSNNTEATKTGRNGCPDLNANDFFDLCKEKGDISTIPNIPGLAVWQSGHIGVYIGDGWVIEARGYAYGVQKTDVTKRNWKKWGKLPASLLTYGGEVPIVPYKLGERTLKKGMTGDDVKELQTALIDLGYDVGRSGADGDYGTNTENGVKAFQAAHGLTTDGIFGAKSFAALQEASKEEGSPDASEPVGSDLPVLQYGARDVATAGTVANLQSLLNKHGAKLTIDGDFGGKTKSALLSFQASKGLAATGITNPKTWELLGQ